MSVTNTDTNELLARFNYLVARYVPLAAELAPKIIQFGKYRQELQAIAVELNERGVKPEEPEDLKHMVEVALSGTEIQ
jgi:hypothetical protein